MDGRNTGFTLIELVLTMLIVSIMAVYAVSKLPPNSDLSLRAQASLFASQLRHTQALAMNWGQPLLLTISANQYTVSCLNIAVQAPCNSNPVIDPASGQQFTVAMPQGIEFTSSTVANNATTEFDASGMPRNTGQPIALDPARQFVISDGANSWTITLRPISGFVETSG